NTCGDMGHGPIDPDTSCSITVTFPPTSPGMKSAQLNVSSSPGGNINAELTATATPNIVGNLAITATSDQQFGTVAIGSQSVAVFIVQNNGTSAVNNINPSIVGPNYTEFAVTTNSCMSASLDPGASCPIFLTFTASVVGTRSASLQVTASP